LNRARTLKVVDGDADKRSVVDVQAKEPPTMLIFISYAREDVQYAKELYQRLERHGFTPWMDKVNLLAGQQWQPAIEKAMKSADLLLLLMSRNSIQKRGFMQREVRVALDLWKEKLADDIYLIPVMLEAIPIPEVPDEVSKFHWVEFYEPDGWEQLVRSMEFQASRRGIRLRPVSPLVKPERFLEHNLPRPTPATTPRPRILRIVVASPSDAQPERDVLPSVIDEVNRVLAADRGLHLVLTRWETDAHPGFHPEGPQGLIDPTLNITDCDLLIGIFWKRFGTPTADGKTGTEHEFNLAYEAWQEKGSPQIFVYFNQKAYAPKSKAEAEQWGQVLEFKDRFPKEGLWWPYKGKIQFEKLVRNHLVNYIRNLT
jgi:hypothetical protein